MPTITFQYKQPIESSKVAVVRTVGIFSQTIHYNLQPLGPASTSTARTDPSSNDTIGCCCYVFFSCKHCPYNQKIQLHDISCLFTPIHCSRHFKPDLQNLEDQTHCHSSEVWINKRECVMLNTAGEVGDVNNGWQTT